MVVQRKPAIKKVGGKVFALDYGRLMGDPIFNPIFTAAARARTLEWSEMNEIESNTSQEIVANLSALALGVLLHSTRAVARVMQTFPNG